MKRYVLNIDGLYSGQTGNALVVSQVDDGFPMLVPSVSDASSIPQFVQKWRGVHSGFSPSQEQQSSVSTLNEYIVEFNLQLQQEFRDSGHQELYMVDDTQSIKPYMSGSDSRIYATDKKYLHCLDGHSKSDNLPSSQVGVLFPYRKLNVKSAYQRDVDVTSVSEIDDVLEQQRVFSLLGRHSLFDCTSHQTMVGGEMFTLSSLVGTSDGGLYGNSDLVMYGMAGCDGVVSFNQGVTLFQPGQTNYLESTIEDFRNWYKSHDHRTSVTIGDTYGNTASSLQVLGTLSYNLVHETHSATDIVLSDSEDFSECEIIRLDEDQFRCIRHGIVTKHRYDSDTRRFIFDNGDYSNVGFMFNLYDNFISGGDRKLTVQVPTDNSNMVLTMKFDVGIIVDPSLTGGTLEVSVSIGGETVAEFVDVSQSDFSHDTITKVVHGVSYQSEEETITARVFFNVDYSKRNTNEVYRSALMNTGVVISNIRFENGVDENPKHLTFGSYVNELGEFSSDRLEQFWNVSRYIDKVAYQAVVDSNLKNVLTSGIEFRNNYSTGDMYGDVFTTKSFLNSKYDIASSNHDIDDNATYDMKLSDDGLNLEMYGRRYVGLGSCSAQLSLFYKPTQIAISVADGTVTTSEKEVSEGNTSEINYQMVETVKNVNRLESSIKHKSNVFSVVVQNSNLAPTTKDEDSLTEEEQKIEDYKEHLRNSITQFVRNVCSGITPVHTQLFDVQFT